MTEMSELNLIVPSHGRHALTILRLVESLAARNSVPFTTDDSFRAAVLNFHSSITHEQLIPHITAASAVELPSRLLREWDSDL